MQGKMWKKTQGGKKQGARVSVFPRPQKIKGKPKKGKKKLDTSPELGERPTDEKWRKRGSLKREEKKKNLPYQKKSTLSSP